jgi:hypothetical protein
MVTTTNLLLVPEIRIYTRTEIEGGIVISYEVRQPGAVNWQPVRLFRSTEAAQHVT